MVPDLSNFYTYFTARVPLQEFVGFLGELEKKIHSLPEISKIQEIQVDTIFKKMHVLLRVKTGTEANVRLVTNDNQTAFAIEPISNIDRIQFLKVLEKLRVHLEQILSSKTSVYVNSAITRNDRLVISLSNTFNIEQKRQQEITESQDTKKQPNTQKINDASKATLPSFEKKLMIIDGNSLMNRAYFATSYKKHESDLIRDHNGVVIGACKVFIELMGKYMKKHLPTHLLVAWDNSDDSLKTFREKLYPAYKAHRKEKEESFLIQRSLLIDMLMQMGFYQITDFSGEYEADDLIGTIAKRWRRETDGKVLIISNDKDLFQLLDEGTSQLLKIKNEEIFYSLPDFQQEYNLPSPLSWIDVKAIQGDSSDNYKGITGVGKKAVIPLLQRYGNLESILEHLEELENSSFKGYVNKFRDGKEEGILSKTLATIVTDAPLPLTLNELDNALKLKIKKENKNVIFKRLGFI